MFLKQFLFFLSIILVSTNHAQSTLVLKAKVYDASTNLPMEFVSVQLNDQYTMTDGSGKFSFKNLCENDYKLTLSHIGCDSIFMNIKITKDTSLKIFLNHTENDLKEIIITRHHRESDITQAVSTMDQQQLKELSGKNISEVLSTNTGVNMLKTGSSIAKPIIHGLHSNRVVVLQNNVRLEGQQWGLEHGLEVDANLPQRLTIIKGASSLQYGSEAIGGVVLLEPLSMKMQKKISGQFNYVFQSANFSHQIYSLLEGKCSQKVPSFWRVQGGYKKAGNIASPNYIQKNTSFEEGSAAITASLIKEKFNAEIYYSFFYTQLGILANSHTGSLADLYKALEAKEPLETASFTYKIGRPKQEVFHHLLKAKIAFKTKDIGFVNLQFSFQKNRRSEWDKYPPRNAIAATINQPANLFDIQTIQAEINWKHNVYKGFRGIIGTQFSTQTNNIQYGYFIPPYWNFSGGIFGIEKWNSKKLEVEFGARLDYKWLQSFPTEAGILDTFTRSFLVPSFSVGIDYHISKSLGWKNNFSTAWRSPAPNELYSNGVHHAASSVEIGDKNLRSEIAFNYTSGLEFSNNWCEFSIDLYSNYIRNFIYQKPDSAPALTIRGYFPAFRYYQTNALLSGSDIHLQFRPTKFLKLTFQSTTLFPVNLNYLDWLPLMPPQKFNYEVRLEKNILKKPLFFELIAIHTLKQRLIPKNNVDFAPPPKGFVLLNFNCGWNVDVGNQNLQVGFSIENMLNKTYRNYLNRFRYYTDEAGLNVRLRIGLSF